MATKTALELLAERKGGSTTSLELALDQYEAWYNASLALSQNKDYEISNGQNSKRKLSRADAKEVEQNLLYWENEVARLQGDSINAPKIRTVFTAGCSE